MKEKEVKSSPMLLSYYYKTNSKPGYYVDPTALTSFEKGNLEITINFSNKRKATLKYQNDKDFNKDCKKFQKILDYKKEQC